MFTFLALAAVLIGSFILATLALPLMLQITLRRLWSAPKPPTEFVVRGTHKELRNTLQRRSRALV